MIKFSKNILIFAILFGLITPSLNLQAQTSKGEVSTVAGGEAAATAAAGAPVVKSAATITAAEAVAATTATACGGAGILESVNPVGDVFGTAGTTRMVALTCFLQASSITGLLSDIDFNASITAGSAAAEQVRAKTSVMAKIIAFAEKIAYILLKKVILDKLVDALVLWINNDGKGAIIESWDQFFADAGQNAVGTFAQGLGAGFLCKPFNLQMQVILLPVDTFSTVSCTLNDIIGNIDSFLGDFRNGSWLAYQETWYPRNNFYGGAIIAMDAAASGAAAARAAAESEAAAGNGFLSFTKDDYFISSTGPYKDKKGTFAEPGYTGIRYVKEKRTVTPGSIAAQAVTESLFTIPGNRLIHSDDMTVYITAILNASINKLTKLGIDGIKGLVGRNTPTLEKIDARNPCGGLTGDGFRACLASVNAENKDLLSNREALITANTSSLPIRVEVANTLNEAITAQNQFIDTLTLATAKNPDPAMLSELTVAQGTLQDLQNKLADNQTFVDALLEQVASINSSFATTTANTAVTPQDWAALSDSGDISFVNDEQVANELLTSAKNDLQSIVNNINTKLLALGLELSTSTPAVLP